jgi:hypothetical protein
MKSLLTYLSIFTLLISCRHDFERPSWNTDISTPVAYTSLNLTDLLKDSSSISFDTMNDNSLLFIYQKEIINYTFDSLINLEPIGTVKNVKLESINFSNTSVSHAVTMGDLISSIDFGTLLFPNGDSAVVPAYSNLLNETFPIDANEYFEEMIFTDGYIDMTLSNNLPTDLSNVVLELRNEGETNAIITMTIPLLSSGTSQTATESLAGQTLFGNLEAEIISADIVGTSPNSVLIDYSDALTANILIRDIDLQEGIAIFPNQEIFDEDTVVGFNIGDVRLSRVLVEEGGVEVVGVSTIQDTLKIEYTIPGTTLNGQPFEFYFELPPAPEGSSISVTKLFDFSGYEIDMTGQYGDTVNTIYTESRGWIDSSGVVTNISLEDSVFNTITIKEIIPKKAWGYMGKDTIIESQEVDFSDFSNFTGQFDIEHIAVKLLTENALGATADVWIKELKSISTQNELALSSTLLSSPISIQSASENPNSTPEVIASNNSLIFDETNSNIDELIENKPHTLGVDFELMLNPNNSQEEGFLFKNYGVKSEMQIEIPLSLSASNITIEDTVDVSFSVENIEQGSFSLLAENYYPIDATIEMILLDQNDLVLESLTSDDIVQASEIDANGKTISSGNSELIFTFNNISESLSDCKKIAFRVVLNTKPSNQFITIYSNYTMELKLVANFNYTVE